MMTTMTMATRRGNRVSKSASWGKRVAKKSSINDGDDDDKDEDNKEVQKGGQKWGGNDNDPSASMGRGSSLSSSDEVIM